jgi:hypothetical protein
MESDDRREYKRLWAERFRRAKGMKDRTAYVRAMLGRVAVALSENPGMSCEKIARLLNVSFMTVSRYRKRLEALTEME